MPLEITKGLAKVGGLAFDGKSSKVSIKNGSATLNLPSIGATSKGSAAITITGAAVGDVVIINPQAALEDDIILSEVVVSADTATVYAYNPTAGAIDPVAVTVDWVWIDLT